MTAARNATEGVPYHPQIPIEEPPCLRARIAGSLGSKGIACPQGTFLQMLQPREDNMAARTRWFAPLWIAGGVVVLSLALHGMSQVVALSQETGKAETKLPINRVVLFSSGVGYFQREGEVTGNADVNLAFPVNDINDLLKSMVLRDLGGGRISVVSLDSSDPVEKTLKSFALDLTQNSQLRRHPQAGPRRTD